MKTILVSGGAGYIGSVTVHRLVELGYKVIVLDNLSRGHKNSLPKEITLIQANIGDEEKVTHILKEYAIDAVMHFAAYAYVGESVQEPELYLENNFIQGLVFLDCVKDAGIKKFIFSSSCATYGVPTEFPITEDTEQKPVNPYGMTKYLFEQALKSYEEAYGLRFVALRYFNAAGAAYDIGEDHNPETHIIPLALQVCSGKRSHFDIFGTDYPTKDGTCIRDYVHILDIAEAHILALKKLKSGSGFYNLGSGFGYSNKDVLQMCMEVTGKKMHIHEKDRRAGDPPSLFASAAKAKKDLGWEPQYSLKDMIKHAWEWHTKSPNGYTKNE